MHMPFDAPPQRVDSPRFKLIGLVPALWVTDQDGRQAFHIADAIVAAATKGALGAEIPWLSPEQGSLFVALGYVEQIGAAPAAAPALEPVDLEPVDLDEPAVLDSDAVNECIGALDDLGCQVDAGAPNARKALRESGRHFGNGIVMLAVRARKARLLAEATAR
jgi:cytochrome c oxidase cbb3-type subunit 2